MGALRFACGHLRICNRQEDDLSRHSHVVRGLLLPIACADSLAAVFWIRAELRHISAPESIDAPWVCSFWSVLGNVAFAWMSAWTCVLAEYLHRALAQKHSTTRNQTVWLRLVWVAPMLLVACIEVCSLVSIPRTVR